MLHPSFFSAEPPSIFQWMSSCLKGEGVQPYPYLPGICERSKLVILVSTWWGQGIQGLCLVLSALPCGQGLLPELSGRETSLKEGEITEGFIYWCIGAEDLHHFCVFLWFVLSNYGTWNYLYFGNENSPVFSLGMPQHQYLVLWVLMLSPGQHHFLSHWWENPSSWEQRCQALGA